MIFNFLARFGFCQSIAAEPFRLSHFHSLGIAIQASGPSGDCQFAAGSDAIRSSLPQSAQDDATKSGPAPIFFAPDHFWDEFIRLASAELSFDRLRRPNGLIEAVGIAASKLRAKAKNSSMAPGFPGAAAVWRRRSECMNFMQRCHAAMQQASR